MRPRIFAEVQRIVGHKLTDAEIMEIADRAATIMEDTNRANAMQTLKLLQENIARDGSEDMATGKRQHHGK